MIYIYTLSDPRTPTIIRYVGQTKHPRNRLRNHCRERNSKNVDKHTWIQNIINLHLKPRMEILDVVNENEWQFWEKYWISQIRTWGFNLLNISEGGCGNYNPTIESRKKTSDQVTNFWKNLATKERFEKLKLAQESSRLIRQRKVKMLKDDNIVKTFESIAAAARYLGNINYRPNITIALKNNWIAYGYNWEYLV